MASGITGSSSCVGPSRVRRAGALRSFIPSAQPHAGSQLSAGCRRAPHDLRHAEPVLAGHAVRTAYAAMFSVLEAAAEGTLDQVDPARADDIPLRGPSVEDRTE
ncbi:MAG: hypothetical protein ACRDPK_14620 [Carbonactinosporaceae bacterium]